MAPFKSFVVTLPLYMDFSSWSAAVVHDLKSINIPTSDK